MFVFQNMLIVPSRPEALELLRVQPPSKVGRDAVRALRLNSGYVSSPRYFLPLGHFLQLV